LASEPERPDQEAFAELQQLVRHLADELAGFRRRALQAEARLKELESAGDGRAAPGGAALERENATLRARLEAASERTRQMLDRMRFLRQQQERGVER
jgi:hypothetical protein